MPRQLSHLDAVNVGAAGTLVIRRPVSRVRLRAEISRRLRFDAEIVICPLSDIVRLIAADVFSGFRVGNDAVRFVSVLSRTPRLAPGLPLTIPSRGRWLVRILARHERIIVGVYRRDMKTIGCLRALDRVFGVPATTRSWNTVTAIAARAAGATSTNASPRRTNT